MGKLRQREAMRPIQHHTGNDGVGIPAQEVWLESPQAVDSQNVYNCLEQYSDGFLKAVGGWERGRKWAVSQKNQLS